MKRTALIAVVITALTFGVVGLAVATPQNVTVNATVNPAFSFTLEGDGSIALAADPLINPIATGSEALRVRSNVPWVFTQGTTVYSDILFGDLMTDTVSIASGTHPRGVTPITTNYTLDMNPATAWSLAPGVYTATYLYTAVQQ